VPLIQDRGSARRINVSLDPGLIEAIDEAAKDRGMTRSAFFPPPRAANSPKADDR